jgi:hypothetical protein
MSSVANDSEWWRNPDGWLFALCPVEALGQSSGAWVIAVLKPNSVNPGTTEDDWLLHDVQKKRSLEGARSVLERLLAERGGGVKLEAPPRQVAFNGALPERVRWWRRAWRTLWAWLGPSSAGH